MLTISRKGGNNPNNVGLSDSRYVLKMELKGLVGRQMWGKKIKSKG